VPAPGGLATLRKGVRALNKMALLVAVVLGIMSIIGIRLYVQTMEQKHQQLVEPIDCFVAAQSIPAGRTFTAEDLVETQFPRKIIDALRSSRVTDRTAILGATTVVPIEAGQVLQQYHFRQAGGPQKRMVFTKEYRAVTVPVNKITGVANLLRAGDAIDVLVTLPLVDKSSQQLNVTRTLLKNVTVLSTDSNTDPNLVSQQPYGSVTLRLRPEEANKVIFCLYNGGMMHMALTQPGTPEYMGYHPTVAEELLGEIENELRNKLTGRGR
jgi:pilus assembly protein CpaB